jgi:hypothetical protein
VEDLTETVVEGIAVKPASGSEFGGGLDDAGNDHGDDEIALAAGSRIEDGIQMQVSQAAEDCGDMAVRQGSGDEEGVRQRGGGASQRAGQSPAESVELKSGEMRDVGDGASLDLAVEAIGFAEEDGGRGVAIGYGGDVHAYMIKELPAVIQAKTANLHAYKIAAKTAYRHQNKEISPFSCQNFGLAIIQS